MADNKWDDLGEELKDAVNDAINSGDFGDLAGSIGDMVNGALYSFSKGVSSSMRDASQRASDRNRMAGDMGRMAGDMGRMAGNMGRMAGGMGRAFGQAAAQVAGGVAQMANDMSARQRADMAASQGLPLYDKSPAKASCVLMMAIGYPFHGSWYFLFSRDGIRIWRCRILFPGTADLIPCHGSRRYGIGDRWHQQV